jgi:hypothetical protein
MTMKEKLALLRQLNATRSKTLHLELELEAHEEDATAVVVAKAKLDKQIEVLRKALHGEWQGRAAQIQDELSAANGRLQATIRDIEKDMNRAEKIVKAVGQVDDIIAKAKALLG